LQHTIYLLLELKQVNHWNGIMDLSRVKVFYDGDNISKYHSHSSVVGFTMNSTFIKQSGAKSWKAFYDTNAKYISGRPISLQVTNDSDIEAQARELHSFGNNVFVKIPVVSSSGESNMPVINKLLNDNIKINITCVFTQEQVKEVFTSLVHTSTPCIVSIFAGGIADTGIEPLETGELAVRLSKEHSNVEILWAGVKDNLAFKKCIDFGCHIITVPDNVMDRMNRIGLNLHQMSIDKVKLFNNDAKNVQIS
jgi:transaldolase